MKNFIIVISFSFFLLTGLLAETANKINITGNNRISIETIKVYGDLQIGKEYNELEINNILSRIFYVNLTPLDDVFSSPSI